MQIQNLTLNDVRHIITKTLQVIEIPLLAFACGITSEKEVYRWAAGDAQPDEDELERLLVIDEVLSVVTVSDGPEVARAWFMGSSCGPDGNQSPMDAIRVCNFDDARGSARRLADNA